jgi:hypothetical protein
MADQVILQTVGDAAQADRILDEFEQRTGLRPDVLDDGRIYEMHDDDHRTQIVQTLTDIDAGWTDHLGFKLPG